MGKRVSKDENCHATSLGRTLSDTEKQSKTNVGLKNAKGAPRKSEKWSFDVKST